MGVGQLRNTGYPEHMIERRPWMLDQYPYPVVVGRDEGGLVIKRILRREFQQHGLRGSKFSVLISKSDMFHHWRCFISGVQCYALTEKMRERLNLPSSVDRPWALSLDHLVPVPRGEKKRARRVVPGGDKVVAGSRPQPEFDDRANRIINHCLMGTMLNYSLGHIPMPLKLLHRSVLAQVVSYDREDYSLATFRQVKEITIETENQFLLAGKYPWQPWTYSEGCRERLAALDLFAQMRQVERDYLACENPRTAMRFIEDFVWRW